MPSELTRGLTDYREGDRCGSPDQSKRRIVGADPILDFLAGARADSFWFKGTDLHSFDRPMLPMWAVTP